MFQLIFSYRVSAFPILGYSVRTASFIRHAFVRGELHNVTAIKPTGIGKILAAKPNRVLAQGKRIIWDDSNSTIENPLLRADLEVAQKLCRHFAPSKIDPSIELSRYEAYNQLKKGYENRVKVILNLESS